MIPGYPPRLLLTSILQLAFVDGTDVAVLPKAAARGQLVGPEHTSFPQG